MATKSTKAETKPKTTKSASTTTSVPKAPKTASKAVAPKTVVVEETKTVVAAPLIKKPELIDRIVAESGMKKKDVKPIVEATLSVLGKALVNGEELQVPPLGKVKINKSKDVANAKVITVKIRQSTVDKAPVPVGPAAAAE